MRQLQGLMGPLLIFAASVVITWRRPGIRTDPDGRERVLGLCLLSLFLQSVHMSEEYVTGFQRRFPTLLGLEQWSDDFFVVFNIGWIGLWCLGIWGFRLGWTAALIPTWFLALALVLNGIAHPLLALAAGGYFPGLWSSPAAGVTGILLVSALWRQTRPR